MKITNQITRSLLGAVISLLLVITPVYAEENGHSNIVYSVTAYGIFNLATNGTANDGRMYKSDDGDYAGWSGQGGGAGIGFGVM